MGFRQPESLVSKAYLISAWTWACCGSALSAEPAKDLLSETRAAIAATNLTPYDVGSRYGQAVGAAETCAGGKMTDKAAVLSSIYSGAHLDEFNAQERKIYDAWMKVKHCVLDDAPNQCKVIIDESCAAALTEIGPAGSAIPGLLEISRP